MNKYYKEVAEMLGSDVAEVLSAWIDDKLQQFESNSINNKLTKSRDCSDEWLNNRCNTTESVSQTRDSSQTIMNDLRDELSETRTALDAVTLDRNQYKRIKELAECKLWDEQDQKYELTAANLELTKKVQQLIVQNENLNKLLNHNSDTVRYYPDVLVLQLNNQINDLKAQLQHQKRCNELLNNLVNANHPDSNGTATDLVSTILNEYILQPAPRGYVMIDSSDLQGRTQHMSVASLIRIIHEIHPDLDLEELTRSICKQLTRNDGAVFNEFYIIRA